MKHFTFLLLILGVFSASSSARSKIGNLNSIVKKVKQAVSDGKDIGSVGNLLDKMEKVANTKERLLIGYRMILKQERRKNDKLMKEKEEQERKIDGYRMMTKSYRKKIDGYKMVIRSHRKTLNNYRAKSEEYSRSKKDLESVKIAQLQKRIAKMKTKIENLTKKSKN